MRGDTRESFASSISRLKGAERLAEADARRSEELDRLITQSKDVPAGVQYRARMASRRARERKRRGPRAPGRPRPATSALRLVRGDGEGI